MREVNVLNSSSVIFGLAVLSTPGPSGGTSDFEVAGLSAGNHSTEDDEDRKSRDHVRSGSSIELIRLDDSRNYATISISVKGNTPLY